MKALDLGQAKVIQDRATSVLGSKAQSANPLDSEKASPIDPQARLEAP